MSAEPAGGGAAAGEPLVAGEALRRVELDVARGTLRIEFERSVLDAAQLVATNLLGPWDGAPGVAEWVRVVAEQAGETCVELRIRYATVPRHYRIAARDVRVNGVPTRSCASTASRSPAALPPAAP